MGAGDGIAYYDDHFYVSMWNYLFTTMTVDGTIYKCDPSDSCELFKDDIGVADMGVYDDSLLCPLMFQNKISSIQLETEDDEDAESTTKNLVGVGFIFVLVTSIILFA